MKEFEPTRSLSLSVYYHTSRVWQSQSVFDEKQWELIHTGVFPESEEESTDAIIDGNNRMWSWEQRSLEVFHIRTGRISLTVSYHPYLPHHIAVLTIKH